MNDERKWGITMKENGIDHYLSMERYCNTPSIKNLYRLGRKLGKKKNTKKKSSGSQMEYSENRGYTI